MECQASNLKAAEEGKGAGGFGVRSGDLRGGF